MKVAVVFHWTLYIVLTIISETITMSLFFSRLTLTAHVLNLAMITLSWHKWSVSAKRATYIDFIFARVAFSTILIRFFVIAVCVWGFTDIHLIIIFDFMTVIVYYIVKKLMHTFSDSSLSKAFGDNKY